MREHEIHARHDDVALLPFRFGETAPPSPTTRNK
jgi:hypothetical protein